MLKKKLILTALGLAVSAGAFAHPYEWREHRPYERHYVRHYYPAPVVVRPYVAPRYVYAPPPVIYRPVPVAPTFSIRLDLPL